MSYTPDQLHETMRLAHNFFKELNLPIWIDSSTILAILRQNKLYDDHCIDLGCLESDYLKVKDKIESSSQCGNKHYFKDKVSHIYMSFKNSNDVELSLGFVSGDTIDFYPVSNKKCTLPWTNEFKIITYEGLDWRVPINIEEHLRLFYGDTWLTDKQNVNWNWKNAKIYQDV